MEGTPVLVDLHSQPFLAGPTPCFDTATTGVSVIVVHVHPTEGVKVVVMTAPGVDIIVDVCTVYKVFVMEFVISNS